MLPLHAAAGGEKCHRVVVPRIKGGDRLHGMRGGPHARARAHLVSTG